MSDKKENVHAGHRQRMRKRFIEHGFEGYEPHEILEMVLYYAVPRKDTNLLAHQLLDRYDTFAKLCDTPIDLLMNDFGLSESAAVLIIMIPQLSSFYYESRKNAKYIDRFEAVEIFRPKFIGATVEKIGLALSDAKDNLIFCDIIASGSLTATNSPVRKIVDLALRHNARYAYIAHNHPSELCVPSSADLKATRVISETLDSVGVMLVDHIVFTSTEHFSIREQKQFLKFFVTKQYGI